MKIMRYENHSHDIHNHQQENSNREFGRFLLKMRQTNNKNSSLMSSRYNSAYNETPKSAIINAAVTVLEQALAVGRQSAYKYSELIKEERSVWFAQVLFAVLAFNFLLLCYP